MKSQGPQRQRKRGNTYAALAAEALENPNEWFEQDTATGSPANQFAYALTNLLCDMVQSDGVLYVRYHGPNQQQEKP